MLTEWKDLILAIQLIFAPLAAYSLLWKCAVRPPVYRALLYAVLAAALIGTMTFPFRLAGETYDFRFVPLTLGILYGGPGVGGALFATAAAYRYAMDVPDTLLYALTLLFALIVAGWLSRKLDRGASLVHSMSASVLLCTLLQLMAKAIDRPAAGQGLMWFPSSLSDVKIVLLQACLTAWCVGLIEFVHRFDRLREELDKKEKERIMHVTAASVAHEIRNPLTSVRGLVQLFAADRVDADKRKYYQQLCLEEIDRAHHLLTDYLALTKPGPEKMEPIHVRGEMVYVSNVLQSYARFTGVEICMIEGGSDGPPIIRGDRNKLRQALINIGKNAIESMQNGGVLEIGSASFDGKVSIVFQDTGTGMSEEQIRRIGTPFYSTKEHGTGLGMMVSFQIIQNMGGTLDIKSEVGKGTRIHLTFPAAEPEEEKG